MKKAIDLVMEMVEIIDYYSGYKGNERELFIFDANEIDEHKQELQDKLETILSEYVIINADELGRTLENTLAEFIKDDEELIEDIVYEILNKVGEEDEKSRRIIS